MKKCTLAADINKCRFFELDGYICKNPGKCSMQKNEEIHKPPLRREKWYEKYYK